MSNLVGSHRFLNEMPIWASALILYAVTLGVIYVGRDYFEGLPYQVAYSAQFGDAALIGAVLIAATILQRGFLVLPNWLMDGEIHAAIGIAAFGLGATVCLATLGSRSGHLMDVYHDAVIGPMILYFAITLLPVIYLGGTKIEKVATVCFILLWAGLVFYDIKAERMDQRSWLQNHGVTFQRK